MSKISIAWKILIMLFTKRKTILGLIDEITDVVHAIRDARDKSSEGGRKITKAELVMLLEEADDVLTRIKELFQ